MITNAAYALEGRRLGRRWKSDDRIHKKVGFCEMVTVGIQNEWTKTHCEKRITGNGRNTAQECLVVP